MRFFSTVLMITPLALVSMLSVAETPWSFKFAASQVGPKSNNGLLAGALESEVSSEIGFTPSIEYTFSPHWVGELLLAIPFEHEVEVTGGELSNSKVASFTHLPPTVSAKYVFTPNASFTPYVGFGLNFTLVFDEETTGALEGTDLSGDNSFGLAANIGFEYRLPNSRWGISGDVRYIEIESDLTLDGADIGTLVVDPLVIGFGVTFDY